MVRTSKGLTSRHQKILDYLNERLSKGYPPSIREIGEATDISSTSVVTYYLKQLEDWGYIERDAKFSRALRLSGASDRNLIKIPILGPIAAIIIYAVYKDRSRYVAYHAMQSFVNQLVWWTGGVALASVFWAIGFALSPVIVGFFCMPVACVFTLMPIVAIVYGIIGGVQTSQGQDFKYWLVGDWTRGTLTG